MKLQKIVNGIYIDCENRVLLKAIGTRQWKAWSITNTEHYTLGARYPIGEWKTLRKARLELAVIYG